MTAQDVLAASRQELALYQELWAVYGRLAERLAEADVDPARLAREGQGAAAVTVALRDLATTLAPHRLSADTLHDDVTAVWRESAVLAAAVADANRRLQSAGRARQNAVAARLGGLSAGAVGTARYRQAIL